MRGSWKLKLYRCSQNSSKQQLKQEIQKKLWVTTGQIRVETSQITGNGTRLNVQQLIHQNSISLALCDWWIPVYPKKYAHGLCFAVLCCGYTLTDFPISTRLTSLALWQFSDCPSASKATLMNMDKYFMWNHYERLHNHNKAKHNKTVCIFIGIYCTCTKTSNVESISMSRYHVTGSKSLHNYFYE